jgi:hypothetical protein
MAARKVLTLPQVRVLFRAARAQLIEHGFRGIFFASRSKSAPESAFTRVLHGDAQFLVIPTGPHGDIGTTATKLTFFISSDQRLPPRLKSEMRNAFSKNTRGSIHVSFIEVLKTHPIILSNPPSELRWVGFKPPKPFDPIRRPKPQIMVARRRAAAKRR